MKLIKKYQSNKTLYKWMIYYIIVIGTIIVALSYIIYSETSFIIDKQILDLYKNQAGKDSMDIDNKLKQLKELGVKYASPSWAVDAAGSNRDLREKFDIIKIQEITREINFYKTRNNYIFDYSLIFPNINNVISETGIDTIDEFFDKRNAFDKNAFEVINSKIRTYNYFEILDPVKVYRYDNPTNVIPVFQTIVYNTAIPRGTLFILINQDSITKNLDKIKQENSESVILYNDGNILGNTKNKEIKNREFINKILGNQDQTQVISEGESFYYIVKSGIAPWRYIYIYPKYMMSSKNRDNMFKIIMYSIMIFGIGILLAIFFSRISYKPVLKILKSVRGAIPESQYKDKKESEFQVIENSMNLLFQEKNEIKKKLLHYEPVFKSNILSRLIKGDFGSEEEGKLLLHEVNLDNNNGSFFNVFVIQKKIESGNSTHEENKDMNYLGKISFISIIESVIREFNLDGQVFESSNERIAVITCLQDATQNSTDMIEKIVVNIKTAIRCNLDKEIYVGIGDIRSRTLGISKSYEKAEKILDWILFTNDDSNANIAKFLRKNNNYYFYPMEWEERMINNLKKGDKEAVENIVKEIKYENCVKRNLQFSVFKRLFMEIIETEMRVIDELNLFSIIDENESERLMSKGKESELWLYIEKLYCDICKNVNEFRKNSVTELNEMLIEYVRNNYQNPDISLKDLADRFELSISKISVIFKELSGYNFLDYVNRNRIDKAKELLEESDDEIQLISSKVGYMCDKSFRRTFRKYQGVSPIEYRMIKKGAS